MADRSKRIRVSTIWWIITGFTSFMGFVLVLMGITIIGQKATNTNHETTGLLVIAVSAYLLTVAGIFATIATKFESEERQETIASIIADTVAKYYSEERQETVHIKKKKKITSY